jgi:hypothetical protein
MRLNPVGVSRGITLLNPLLGFEQTLAAFF